MKRNSKTVGIVILGALALVAIFRLFGSGEQGPTDREVSRLFVCEMCGELHPVSPDVIREQYEAETVETGRDGPRFVCQGCGKPGARIEVLDFDSDFVRCETCERILIEDVSDAMKAAKRGGAETDAKGRLTFKCDGCDTFTGLMTPRNPPVDMEE